MNNNQPVTVNKKHYAEIDIYRGLGIILVVLGHALKQTGETNAVFDILLSVIYSFHMPLFFVASGFIAIKVLDLKSKEEQLSFIKNRAIRLLIPYFAVGLFYMPIKFILSKYAVKPYDFSSAWKLLIGENPNTVLWFLYTLFIVSIICVLILNHKNITSMLLISAIISVIAWAADTEINTFKYLFFFIAGIYIRKNYDDFGPALKEDRLIALASAVTFLLTNVFMLVTDYTGWTFVTAISGCILFMYIAVKINASNGAINKITNICGSYSMDIYILSDLIATAVRILVWGILSIHYIPCTIICFIVSMFLPIPISKYIIRKIKVLKLLVLGER